MQHDLSRPPDALATSSQRVRQARREHQGWSARFAVAATKVSEALGSALAFLVAALVIVVWAVTGPIFGFSDTWQLVINTGTTIITFLMVFVIQNTQNRDAKATQVKLDELIRSVETARNRFIGVEEEDEEQLDREKEEVEESRDEQPRGDEDARRAVEEQA